MDEIIHRFVIACIVVTISIVSMIIGYYLHHNELNKQIDALSPKEFDAFIKMMYARRNQN